MGYYCCGSLSKFLKFKISKLIFLSLFSLQLVVFKFRSFTNYIQLSSTDADKADCDYTSAANFD